MDDYDFGAFSTGFYLNLDQPTQQQFQQAKIEAAAKDKWWEQILNGVVKYGDPFLTMLSKNGIIPNKNLQAVLKGQYDQNAMAQLLAANGGTLDKSPNQIVDRSAKIFGLDTSTLVLIVIGILLLMVFQKNK